MRCIGLHGGVVVSVVATQQQVGFHVEFPCSPCVRVGSLQMIWLLTSAQKYALIH